MRKENENPSRLDYLMMENLIRAEDKALLTPSVDYPFENEHEVLTQDHAFGLAWPAHVDRQIAAAAETDFV